MRSVLTICALVVTLMLFAFQPKQARVSIMKNGNYSITKKVAITEADAKTLSDLTRKAADETTAVNTKVYKDAVDKTVYTTTKSSLKDKIQEGKVRTIMNKYAR